MIAPRRPIEAGSRSALRRRAVLASALLATVLGGCGDRSRGPIRLDDFVDCSGVREGTRGLVAWGKAIAGRTGFVPAGCVVVVGGPPAGEALVTLASHTRIVCENQTATFQVARRRCIDGHVEGAACATDADCNPSGSGGRCVGDGGVGAVFAPSANGTYTIFKGAAGSVGQRIERCSFRLEGFDGWNRCTGGSRDGAVCGQTCATALHGVRIACNADADCAPLSAGACEHRDDCANGGGRCDGAAAAPAGPGRIDPIDFSSATGALVSDVAVYDQRRGNFTVRVGAHSKVVGLDNTRRTDVSTPHLNPQASAPPVELPRAVVLGEASAATDSRIAAGTTAGSVGIQATAGGTRASRNTVVTYTGFGIQFAGGKTHVDGNVLTGAGDGLLLGVLAPENAPAFCNARDNYVAPSAPTGRGIVVGCGQQTSLRDNKVYGGHHCIVVEPNVVNVSIENVQCLFGRAAKLVLNGAGIRVAHSYFAWGGGQKTCGATCSNREQACASDGGCAGCAPGADRCVTEPVVWLGGIGARAGATGHLQFVDNILFSNVDGVSLLKAGDMGKRCSGRGGPVANAYRPCAVGNCARGPCVNGTCALGGATCCDGSGGRGICEPSAHSADTIATNEFFAVAADVTGVDLSLAGHASGDTSFNDLASSGNHFSLQGPRAIAYDLSAGDAVLTRLHLGGDAFDPGIADKIKGWTWTMGTLAEPGPLDPDDDAVQTTFLTRGDTGPVAAGDVVEVSPDVDDAFRRASTGVPVGILLDAPADGRPATIAVAGSTRCNTVGPVARGAALAVSTTPGKLAVAATNGARVVAVALGPATNDRVRCLLGPVVQASGVAPPPRRPQK